MIEQCKDVDELFGQALGLTAGERGAFLDAACEGRPELRQRLERLLMAYPQAQGLLETSAVPGPSAADDRLHAEIGTQIGPYKLLEVIGEGGMGLVYMAEQQRPVRRLVALKIIKPGLDSRQVIARFEAERQALAMMDHPGIARILEAGTVPFQISDFKFQIEEGRPEPNLKSEILNLKSPGRPYFVMELVRGLPITEFCDHKQLGVRERLELFIQVCQAVQHAHQKGVIHRDLKPTNVLVTMHDAVAVPKIIDFGIAKALGQSLTEHTLHTGFAQLVGTPLYMSPEQAEMNQFGVDTRSDVYSLGVMLYELLTGATPFDKETLKDAGFDEMRRLIREVDPPRPSARLSTLQAQVLSTVSQRRGTDPRRISLALRGELDWIVMRALEKDRNRRYESASDLAHEIQRYLNNEPIQAGPPSAVYRLRKYVQRNRSRVAAAALAAAIVGVVVVGGGVVFARRQATQQHVAQDVQQFLTGARTAVEAGDLPLAQQRVSEAKGRLGDHRSSLHATVADVDKFTVELAARRADQQRFERFVKLTRESQDKMSFGGDPSGERAAREALELYGVLTADDWLTRLEQSYLRAEQKRQVQETAYETLVSIADYGIRWRYKWSNPGSPPPLTVEECLALLERAQSFHQPTRAFWFVHRGIQKLLKDEPARQESGRRFQTAVATNAWDYFLPGHSAGWNGDIDEAIRSYQAALHLQPDHYNSLFFLAMRLDTHKADRRSEAIGYYTGAIALRQDDVVAYRNRGLCNEKLGRLEEAEADFSAAISVAKDDEVKSYHYRVRSEFYARSGQHEKARADTDRQIALLVERLKISQPKPRHTDRETLGQMHELAHARWKSGEREEAIRLFEEVLELQKVTLGAEDPATLQSMYCLSMSYTNAGTPERAAPLLEAFDLQVDQQSDPALKRSALTNLAQAYLAAGNVERATATLQEILERNKVNPDSKDPGSLKIMLSLGECFEKAGKEAEARQLWYEMFAMLRATDSSKPHKDLLGSVCNLANRYQDAGKLNLAIFLYETTHELMKARLGPGDMFTLTSMTNLASAYHAVGRLEDARLLCEEVLDLCKAKQGPEHLEALNKIDSVALLYKDMGRIDEAMSLVQDSVKVREAKVQQDVPGLLNSRNNLAVVYLAAGKADLALPLLTKTLETARLKLAADHLYTIESILRLSAANLALGKTDEALPLASEAYDLAKTKFGLDDPWTLECLQNLGDVHQGAGNLEEAQRCYQEALELRKARPGPQHPDTLGTLASLGFNLASQRKHAEAEPLLLAAYEGLKAREDKRLLNGKPWIDVTLEWLVALYTAWDKPEEAARWRALLPAPATTQKNQDE